MPVQFENFTFTYVKRGKPYYAPTSLGRRIGKDIKAQVEAVYQFDPFIYHLGNGGHIAALHAHRHHALFARVDIKRFFYGISRSRVQRALTQIGILRSRHYAKWSCVRNPFVDPTYSLPYGFVQSPILATLVLLESVVGNLLRSFNANPQLVVSVYMDDITLSCDNAIELQKAFEILLSTLSQASFEISLEKVRPPAISIDLFNCDLQFGVSQVRQDRVDRFIQMARSQASIDGFAKYQQAVEQGNI